MLKTGIIVVLVAVVIVSLPIIIMQQEKIAYRDWRIAAISTNLMAEIDGLERIIAHGPSGDLYRLRVAGEVWFVCDGDTSRLYPGCELGFFDDSTIIIEMIRPGDPGPRAAPLSYDRLREFAQADVGRELKEIP